MNIERATYTEFLKSKMSIAPISGIEVARDEVNPLLFDLEAIRV